ncbi:hypothetical protein DL770_011533 [Monosporascus sp. CRB-9-2]|nr:hypothetical protein DL770_011533 [Monosporascus sp. CRB-9-2]
MRERPQLVPPLAISRRRVCHHNKTFGQGDLLVQRSRIDHGADNIRREGTPCCLQFAATHIYPRRARGIGLARGTEQVEGVMRLQLANKHVVAQRFGAHAREVWRALACGLRPSVQGRQC